MTWIKDVVLQDVFYADVAAISACYCSMPPMKPLGDRISFIPIR